MKDLDWGYISQELFEMLFVDDIHLVAKLKKNMKNSLMNLYDKILLRKRALVETVNDELKNVCHIEHTRHRSIDGFASNRRRTNIDKQVCRTSKTRNEYGIHKHSNQQGERVG